MSGKKLPRAFVVANEDSTKTIEEFLVQTAKLGPRSALKRAFTEKKITINGRIAKRQDLLQSQDQIEVFSDDLYLSSDLRIIANRDLSLSVLEETPDFVVIDKPAGQNAHPLRPDENQTALNALAVQYPETAHAMNPLKPLEGGLVHRIDRGTSGVLVCARNTEAWAKARSKWKDLKIEKIYLAWVEGVFNHEGRAEITLDHDLKSKKKMAVSRTDNGYRSVTSLLPLAQAESKTLVLLRIHTGVTHQIRATLAALGHPVLGDSVYKTMRPQQDLELLSLDHETREIFQRKKNLVRMGSFPNQQTIPSQGFFLHALWIKIAIPGLEKGIFAQPPDYF